MTIERFLGAASPILNGDESRAAAAELEGVIISEHLEDERFADLLYVLALYAPGVGMPYSDADELRVVLQRTIHCLELGGVGENRGAWIAFESTWRWLWAR